MSLISIIFARTQNNPVICYFAGIFKYSLYACLLAYFLLKILFTFYKKILLLFTSIHLSHKNMVQNKKDTKDYVILC